MIVPCHPHEPVSDRNVIETAIDQETPEARAYPQNLDTDATEEFVSDGRFPPHKGEYHETGGALLAQKSPPWLTTISSL